MYSRTRIYKIIFLSLLLNGCVNSMYFYETEKISLTVDARPDPSQPVQGNLGIKQRVALIVPKKGIGDGAIPKKINDDTDDGEALASISSFNFRIMKKDWALNPILVQMAFITGDAAVELYKDKDPSLVADVAKAITVEDAELPSLESYAVCIADKMKSDSARFNKLKEITNRENFDVLSNDEWKEFETDFKVCKIRTRLGFTNSIRKALQKEINKMEK